MIAATTSPPEQEGRPRWEWAIPALVAVAAFIAFLPTLQNGFVTWDDDTNFLNNANYRGLGWAQLQWMWTTFHMGHYVPISWMTLGLDYVLWGMNPAGYHLVSLLLHSANAVLLYFLARRLLRLSGVASDSGSVGLTVSSAFAALFFAIHPLRVESVAWVTERRDVLSLFFYLSSILFYLRAVERSDRRRWYVLSAGTFVLALLSKGTSVTLPAVLLILNVYPLERLGGRAGWWGESSRRVYAELVPFALLSVATSVLSMVALSPWDQLSLGGKLAVCAYSLSFYLWKTIAPTNLAPLYEMPKQLDPLALRYLVSYVVVIALTAGAWIVRRRWPGVTTAWFAFLAIILPMLGIVQNGPQIAADRYTYHAAPVLALLAGAGLSLFRRPRVASAVGGAIVVVLGALTWNQTRVWHDSERLWSRILSRNPESSLAHTALANVLIKDDRVDEAIEHYRRVVVLDPESTEGDNNLGVALARRGRFAEAVEHYQRALAIRPTHYEAHNNLGVALAQLGDLGGAIEQYRQALAIKPDFADAHTNWGNALVRLRRLDEAIAQYQESLQLRPDHADTHLNWGVALAQQGKLSEAIEHFRQALVIQPDHAEAQQYLEQATQLLQQRSAGRSR